MSINRATAELRRWIVKQFEQGQTPEWVIKEMMSNGWSEASAIDVIERTLQMRVAEARAARFEGSAASVPEKKF